MKRNVLNFFKASACARSFFVFGAAFLAILSISCKQLASFDPMVNGEQMVLGSGNSGGGTSSSEAAEFSFNLKASHGLMRKISLEWTAFSGAKYYEIYFAESATAEFIKITETEQPFFDDTVAAGRTGYFKVCAVKANGTRTPFSSTVVGTSLAVPVISGGDVSDSSATITWFMENARSISGENYYEDLLKFEVFCGEKSQTLDASSFSNGSYKCTFENLAGSTDYQIYVKAYLSTDQQSTEESAKVTSATLTSYMPLAPLFNVSEGESAKGIRLYIKLPEKVMVSTVTKESPNEKEDKPCPLYFKIFRRIAEGSGDYGDAICKLYYNGSTEPPNPADYDDNNPEKCYKAGVQITWLDKSADLLGGVKYEYMIRSFVDCNYGKVVRPDGEKLDEENTGTAPEKATKGIGWKSAHPSFKLKMDELHKTISTGEQPEVLSYEFGFSASWNDLGKADKYKFAIKQNCLDNGKDEWHFFDTLDKINSHLVKFGSASGLRDDEKGVYAYTLYIVSKNVNGAADINDDNVLDSVTALDTIQVTPDVNLPKAVLDVEGGYANKVVLTISSLDKNDADVTYKITRTILEGSGTGHDFDNLDGLHKVSDGIYEDTTVQGNCRYSYVLTATSGSGAWAKSLSQEAETLGRPVVSFSRGDLSYDSVTVSFDGVLAAKEYTVTLGAGGGFGGGKTYSFAADGTGVSGNAEVKLEANKFTVTIKQPYGYDDAELAGMTADAVVTAKSGVDNAPSDPKEVNVLGPALLEAQVNAAGTTGESISLTWKEVGGAKGYLIRRVMYEDAAMTKIAEGSDVTYYCDAESKKVTFDGEDVGDRANAEQNGNTFTFTDTYMEKSIDNADLETYQEAQAKLAWGLPFRYVVLPVLGKNDFDFNDLGLKSGSKVAYTNLEPTAATATWGYGLNLVAEKAMSGTTQHLKWEKPYNAQLPVVYYRVAGSDDTFKKFEGYSTVANGTNTGDLTIDSKDYYDAFEYVVKYYSTNAAYTDSEIKKFPPSLLAEIKKNTQTYDTPLGAMTELNNKGYLLTVGGFDAYVHPDKNYYEQIRWSQWQYDKRAVGPDSMIILVQNNNIDATPHELVSIEKANVSMDASIKIIADDIKVEKEQNTTICVAPAGIVAGTKSTTDGLLKVLRDYKHNYMFKLQRNGIEEPVENDIVKTAYRQITDEELVRAATLAMSIGFERAFEKRGGLKWSRSGDPNISYDDSSNGNGKVDFKSHTGNIITDKNYTHTIIYTNFIASMQAKAGVLVKSFLTVDGTIVGRVDYTDTCPPKTYDGTITITSGIDMYKSTLTFNSLQKTSGNISIKRGSTTSDFTNITPLPFKSDKQGDSKYSGFNDSEEWQ